MSDDPACWEWAINPADREQVATCPEHFAHVLLWNWQRGRCAACGTAGSATVRTVRDHDHATGLVRGILCQRCNVIEGWAAATSRPDFVVPISHGSGRRDFSRWREANAAAIAKLDKYRHVNPASLLEVKAQHAATKPPAGISLPRAYHHDLPILDVPVDEWIRFRRRSARPGAADRRMEVIHDFVRHCLERGSVERPWPPLTTTG